MSLSTYNKKRKFKNTPEPKAVSKKSPKNKAKTHTKSPASQLRFCVQKHHASRLHYDFRLEFDGVLKSWAVPKGPSLDPEIKRLAMMVEDHPLDYMTFEGTIPKGNYGAGDVIVWDMGVYHSSHTLDPKENIEQIRMGFKKGHIDFVLFGEKLKGHFSLIKLKTTEKNSQTDENAWLLMKHEDAYASKKDVTKNDSSVLSNNILHDTGPIQINTVSSISNMPHQIQPMLATLVDEPFDKDGWLFEFKWDGYRAIAEIENGSSRLYSRKGNSFEKKFPSIAKILKELAQNGFPNTIFDGEIIALNDGRPDFHALQNYNETKIPLHYVIFDLLYYDGIDFRHKPLIERKTALQKIIPKHPQIILSEHIEKNGKKFFNIAKKAKFEGIIAKDMHSSYVEGHRSASWLKFKYQNEQEAIIVGYTEPRGSRKKFGALVLAAYRENTLIYIGHSGGGFTDTELGKIYTKLSKIKIETSPFSEKIPINSPISWVQPKYVCQVKFTEWTPDGRMRHPIYAGLREDKDPKDVVIEKPGESDTIIESKPSRIKKNTSEISDQKFTNLDKIFWPGEKHTKGDVIGYYEKISDIILPYLKDRPESLHRHPHGIQGKSFFHKDIEMKVPDFVETKMVWSESNEKEIRYLVCQNKETLLYMANLGCIEINPWNSRIQNLDKPDYMIIDLDPGNNTFDELIQVALVVHEILTTACQEHYCKTSGKTGLHILVPFGAQYEYEIVRNFSHLVVQLVHQKIPELTSIERSPAKRRNKIYLDYLQNRRGQTIAAPYSLRPYPGATVSTPLQWKEVKKGLNPSDFTIQTIFKRLKKLGDLWKPMLKNKVDLEESMRCLEKLVRNK